MIITSYENAKKYLAVMQDILEEKETENSLMLGILLRLQQKGDAISHPPFMRTTHDIDGLLTAALFTPPNRPVLIYNDRSNVQDSLSIIASDIVQNGWKPSGVLATSKTAETFAFLWSKASGRKSKLSINERLYECKQVRRQNHASGLLRLANEKDKALLIEWSWAFTKECGLPETEEQSVKRIEDALAAKTAYLWDNSGLSVSMVLKTRPTRHTITLSGVYTPPSLRGKGFASAAVSTLTEQLLESDYQSINLFTDLSNPSSNAIYQRIGYVPVLDYNFYQFTNLPLSEE